MSDSLYTKSRFAQFRGPTTSEDYNDRIEENYRDLVVLKNRTGALNEETKAVYRRLAQEMFNMQRRYDELEERVGILEDGTNTLSFYSNSQIDNDRFDSTSFAVPQASRCFHDVNYGLIVLPRSSSMSKFKSVNANGQSFVPSSFEASANGVPGTLDRLASSYVVDSDIYFAVVNEVGKVYERNVIAEANDPAGAAVDLYMKVPTEFLSTDKSNVLVIHPYPVFGCEIESVEYTTTRNPSFNSTDSYSPLNSNLYGNGDMDAVGWVAPGAWSGDEIVNSGIKAFYFDSKDITALKIRLRQKSFIVEGGKFLYAYGLSNVDLRYDSFSNSGRTIIRFDAPDGSTISDVSNVELDIYNIAAAANATLSDYRIIWETAYDSGTYTTSSVPFSQRVWVEVTLNKADDGTSPALSGLTITYS